MGKLAGAFAEFSRRFSDHPTPDNTQVYLEFHGDGDQSPPSWSLSWCCGHFEHEGRDDIVQLVEFLDVLSQFHDGRSLQFTRVEALHEDRLHLKLYGPAEDVREEVIRFGRELEEWDSASGGP